MMRFNGLFKSTIIALPILVLAACSSDQSATDQNANNAGTTTQSTNDNGAAGQSSADQAQAQLQQLQQNNTVYFGFDQYDVSPDFSTVLDGHADYLRNNPNAHVIVQGYTDERGTPEYNIALGERRATAVKMYLQGKGVPASQIATVSYGKEKPAVLGHDEAAYAKNRRAVLIYNQ